MLFGQDSSKGPPAILTFKSTARIVVVDVVATDNKGQPVHNLKAEDFSALDEGKAQSIVAFEEERSDANPTPAEAVKLPDQVYTNFVSRKERGALTVLLFDSLNTDRADLPNARNEMLSFLRKLPAGQRVAIYSLGSQLRLVQSFTDDSGPLIAAAQSLTTHSHVAYSNARELSAAIGGLEESAISTTPAFAHLVQFLGEEYQGKLDSRSQLTFDALAELARALAVVPGRKNLIWISAGLPFSLSSNGRELEKIAAQLAATRIAVYPVDVRGIVLTGPDGQTRDVFSQTDSYETFSGTDQENGRIVETMQNIASITGGRAHVNNNNLEGAIAESMRTGSNYYSLTYRPTEVEWNGKFRKITIKTSRRDVKLLYRSGYYAVSDMAASRDDPGRTEKLAMQPTAPVSTQLIVKARIVPPASGGETTGINILVDLHDLALSEENGQKTPDLEFMAVAWDAQGKESARFSGMFRSPLAPPQLEDLFRTGLQVHEDLQLKAGSYQLRLGVMDRLSGRIGTLDVPLTVGTKASTK